MSRSMSAIITGSMLLVLLLASRAAAIPAFARKYQTSCSTCHYAYPKLNKFGRTFLNNGFRYPKGEDPSYIKEDPTSMGAERYKEVFPDAIWPSDIPGSAPVSIRMINRVNFQPDQEPRSSFEFPKELGILFGGTLGESFSFFGGVEYENADEFDYDFYLQYNYRPAFNVKLGKVDPSPIANHMRLSSSSFGYLSMQVSESGWRLRNGQSGMELWGVADGPKGYGGFKYQIGLVNGQNSDTNDDVNNSKDYYSIFSYKIGGMGVAGGAEPASTKSAFWRDNSFTLGFNTYNGKSTYGGGFENSFNVVGVFWDLWFDRLNLWHSTQFQKDDNPIANSMKEVRSMASSTEADLVLYPWLIAFARYDYTDNNRDDSLEAQKLFVPGMVAMIRANIKVSCEMQWRQDDAGDNQDQFVIGIDFAM